MSQVTTGLRRILSSPFAYNFLQDCLGAKKSRQKYVSDYVRPSEDDKILDIGCGTGDVLNFLPATIQYVGFDLNRNYIEYAKKKFNNHSFICANTNDGIMASLPKFDIILATGLLHHLDDAEAISLFEMSKRALKETGRLITFDCCYTENQSKLARFIIKKDRGQNIRTIEGYNSLALQIFKNIKIDIRHDLLRIPYTHIIMECRL